MANLPEKVMRQRLMLQLQSLDSPSELPGASFRPSTEMGVSPMTDLAHNLHSSRLDMTPSPGLDSKRRLSLDFLDSSDCTPNPLDSSGASNDSPAPMPRCDSTPLSSITNKPARTKLGFTSRLTTLKTVLRDTSPSDKENLAPIHNGLFSPGKRLHCGKLARSPSLALKTSSPAKEEVGLKRAKSLLGVEGGLQRRRSVKRPMFSVLDEEDSSSRDSGYNSQQLEVAELEERQRKKSRAEEQEPGESLQQMLADCSPGKEEGFAALPESPEAKVEQEPELHTDGFDVTALLSVAEDQGADTTRSLNSMSFLDNPIILPHQLEGAPAFTITSPDDLTSDLQLLDNSQRVPQHRPQIRRALSMMEPRALPSISGAPPRKLSFKRPDPPREGVSLLGGKKRRVGDVVGLQHPVPLFRSHSESELNIMRACQQKEDTPDILPDSSRLYSLPSLSAGSKHPSLRSITCDTLAELMEGRYSSTIRSFRVVDVRYQFEYEGGHIQGAENWQHGEDEQFLTAFLPTEALGAPPPSYDSATHDPEAKDEQRDILIFHCEFSSQRGPDFYMKLRERDRQLNKDVYPGLHFPECYLLHLGYKEFWRRHPSLCTGSYTEMIDPRHESDLRKMRAKSKSWSGGTVARTSRLGRLNL